MNTFTGLKPEENDTIEINNPKDLKKYQKKLKYKKERLNKCDCPNQTEKLFDEIRIIEVEIDEYLNRNKGIPVKKCKPKPEVKQEFVFDKKVKEETRKFNEKRSREIKEKEESERKARKEEEEKNSKFWDEWENRFNAWDNEENARKAKREAAYQKYKQQRQQQQQEEYKKPFNLNEFIKECGLKLKDVPKDIKNLYYDFSMKKYKILSRNYHPDKSSSKQEYMIILNGIRDHHNPNNLENDETWIK